MDGKTGIILFGHGARDPEWAAPMRRVQAQIQAAAPELLVELGFLEFTSPDLDGAVAALAATGATRVRVLPMFLAQGGHLKRDLPLQVAEARERHPGLELILEPAIGEAEAIVGAMAAHALALGRA